MKLVNNDMFKIKQQITSDTTIKNILSILILTKESKNEYKEGKN